MSPDYDQLLPRWPVEVPLNEDEEKLFGHLEHVFEEYWEVTDFSDRATPKVILLVLTYLGRRGLSGQAMKPLIDVFMALQDVENGVLPELFDPKAESNSGPDGLNKWSRSKGAEQVKYYAAACMSALMKTGVGKKEAAKRVERAAQSWARFSSGIIKASTIANWRDEFLKKTTADPGRLVYESSLLGFSEGPKAAKYLDGVLRKEPPLTGGMRRPKT